MAKRKRADATFVLDGSIALTWCFHDEANAYADDIASTFPKHTAIVPMLWHLEVANAFLVGERRGRSTPADTAEWTAFLTGLPIAVDDETIARAWRDIVNIARSFELSSYDAAYLELAIRRGLRLATLDKKLKKAASAAGVGEFRP